ncbi:MAG: SpoIID/LytB domain-containing protein [Planctomycetota bacterium]|jgi:stage II sporulation protein D|nr:SpoIID/LytB domain-containing protein [Planctomycetota bacterium]
MARWLLKFIVLVALGAGFFHIAFRDAPDDFDVTAGRNELLAATMPSHAGQPQIRVLVADALDIATLALDGMVRMEGVIHPNMTRRAGEFAQSVAVDIAPAPNGNGVNIGADRYVRARIRPLGASPIKLSWRSGNQDVNLSLPYEIEIYAIHVRSGDTLTPKIRILARLPLEEYLYGVVASEVPTSWPLEALRSQAVASRTYAYFEIRSRRNEEYDVHAGTRSQVWRPATFVEPPVRRAVDSTQGIVITEKNALIKTFFHSECGGFTADARWVFTKTPILALSGVRCPRCANQANRPTSWSVAYSRQEIAARLGKAGLFKQGGEIRNLQALDQDGNPMGRRLGRAVTIEITLAGGSGTTIRIPANEFRLAMGADRNNLASTYMTIEGGSEARIAFSGLGWGHGVGLCQHGAAFAADRLGYSFMDILALYYPGSKLVRLWGAGQ